MKNPFLSVMCSFFIFLQKTILLQKNVYFVRNIGVVQFRPTYEPHNGLYLDREKGRPYAYVGDIWINPKRFCCLIEHFFNDSLGP